MAYTYTLSTDVGKVRLYLPDNVENSGPFPSGVNFSDAELTQILTDEGDDVMRAVAAGCEILAGAWSAIPDWRTGPRGESPSKVAEGFERRAASLRAQYGGGASGVSFFARRADGYSANADSADDPTDTEND